MRRHDRQIIEPASILAIIEAADSCRLGLVDDSGPLPQPYIVALNFAYEQGGEHGLQGTFWFHGASVGRKLELIRRSSQVCIQLDGEHEPVKNALGCGWGMKYASVVALGQASIVAELAERRRGLQHLMAHYVRLWGPAENLSERGPAATSPSALPDDTMLERTVVFRAKVENLSAKRKP
jgi:uncharacterized protein